MSAILMFVVCMLIMVVLGLSAGKGIVTSWQPSRFVAWATSMVLIGIFCALGFFA